MADPVPLAGLGVSQPALLSAVQVASLDELVSETGSVPPAGCIVALVRQHQATPTEPTTSGSHPTAINITKSGSSIRLLQDSVGQVRDAG